MRGERVRRILGLLPVFAAVCLLVLNPERASSAAKDGVRQCLETVLPSLFPFFVLSRLLLNGVGGGAEGRLARRFRRVFAVPSSALPVFVMGLVSGFPVGGSAAAELYRRGFCTKDEAERLLVFCNNCGPGFLFGAVSLHLCGGAKDALLLWLLQGLVSLWLGILLGAGQTVARRDASESTEAALPLARAFPAAVRSGGRSALIVCAYVVFFAALTAFLPENALLRGVFELTGGILRLPQTSEALPLCAFLIGFGGLSVATQVLAALEGTDLRGAWYIPGRLLHGLVMAASVLILQHMPFLLPVWISVLTFSAFFVVRGRKRRKSVVY